MRDSPSDLAEWSGLPPRRHLTGSVGDWMFPIEQTVRHRSGVVAEPRAMNCRHGGRQSPRRGHVARNDLGWIGRPTYAKISRYALLRGGQPLRARVLSIAAR